MKIVDTNNTLMGNIQGPKSQGNKSFKNYLNKAFESANTYQKQYETLINRQILGEEVNLHNVVIAGEKARLSLELTLQVRNKAIEAYQEIMRMQV